MLYSQDLHLSENMHYIPLQPIAGSDIFTKGRLISILESLSLFYYIKDMDNITTIELKFCTLKE